MAAIAVRTYGRTRIKAHAHSARQESTSDRPTFRARLGLGFSAFLRLLFVPLAPRPGDPRFDAEMSRFSGWSLTGIDY